MIKRFSAQGGKSIGLIKDSVINTSELHVQKGKSRCLGKKKAGEKVHSVTSIITEESLKVMLNVKASANAYSQHFVLQYLNFIFM